MRGKYGNSWGLLIRKFSSCGFDSLRVLTCSWRAFWLWRTAFWWCLGRVLRHREVAWGIPCLRRLLKTTAGLLKAQNFIFAICRDSFAGTPFRFHVCNLRIFLYSRHSFSMGDPEIRGHSNLWGKGALRRPSDVPILEHDNPFWFLSTFVTFLYTYMWTFSLTFMFLRNVKEWKKRVVECHFYIRGANSVIYQLIKPCHLHFKLTLFFLIKLVYNTDCSPRGRRNGVRIQCHQEPQYFSPYLSLAPLRLAPTK